MIRFRKSSFLICCICIAVSAVVILGRWLSGSRFCLSVVQMLGMLSEENPEKTLQAIATVGRLLLIAEYFLLGLLVCWLVAMLRPEALEVFLVSASCSFTFSCVCETLHMILPNSSGTFSNLLWSAIGIAAGSGILVLLLRFCKKTNRKPVHTPKHAAKKPHPKRREMPKFEHLD